jgi:DNA-binding transcriptional ArsR family regulator
MFKMDLSMMEENAERASQLLTAMSNPKRLMILCNLLDREMSVNEIAEHVELAQSPLSQHLSKLRAWGFVRTRRDGQQIHYSLASDEVREILKTLYSLYCVPGMISGSDSSARK